MIEPGEPTENGITLAELARILESESRPAAVYALMRAAGADWARFQRLFARAYPRSRMTLAMKIVFAERGGGEDALAA